MGKPKGHSGKEIKSALHVANVQLAADRISPFVILDDLENDELAKFEIQLKSLIISARLKNGFIIVTTQKKPPTRVLNELWLSDASVVEIPRLKDKEIAELLILHGLNDSEAIHVDALGEGLYWWTPTIDARESEELADAELAVTRQNGHL